MDESSIPYGELTLTWWETGRADPDDAQDWLAARLEELGERFKAEFPTVVSRVSVET